MKAWEPLSEVEIGRIQAGLPQCFEHWAQVALHRLLEERSNLIKLLEEVIDTNIRQDGEFFCVEELLREDVFEQVNKVLGGKTE